MIIFWICGIITLGGAAVAAFISDIRMAALALWLVGLGIGGLYLSVGAEFLAILQWIASTLVAVGFIFYAVLFGEYSTSVAQPRAAALTREELRARVKGWLRKNLRSYLCALLLGGAFAALVWIASRGMGSIAPETPAQGDLLRIGQVMTNDHLLSLEIFGLTLFLVIVGAGVIARPENGESDGGQEP